jgi:hypothetical protein
VIDRLNREFVNTWIVDPWFARPEDYFADATARKWAGIVRDEFTYPVDSIVLSPDGRPLSQMEVGEIFVTDSAVGVARYHQLLDESRQ